MKVSGHGLKQIAIWLMFSWRNMVTVLRKVTYIFNTFTFNCLAYFTCLSNQKKYFLHDFLMIIKDKKIYLIHKIITWYCVFAIIYPSSSITQTSQNMNSTHIVYNVLPDLWKTGLSKGMSIFVWSEIVIFIVLWHSDRYVFTTIVVEIYLMN